MVNNGGNQKHARSNGQPIAKLKLPRRQQLRVEQKRCELLARILEESSSLKLNEPTSQWNARQAIEDHTQLFDLIAELRAIEARLNPELPRRDERSWSKFIKWYSSEELKLKKERQLVEPTNGTKTGQVRLFDLVGIKRRPVASALDDSEEHALFAKVPFKKGERIFEIDRSFMLTTESAMSDSDLNDFIRRDSIASGMPNVVLVLHLLNEYSKGEQSRWWPYLSILPNKILPILQMDKKQMSTYLVASSNLHSVLKMVRAITRQYSYFYKRLQSTTLPIRHKFTLLLYFWGVSVVCSRQNEIPPKIRTDPEDTSLSVNPQDKRNGVEQSSSNQKLKSVHALIPVLDMCNHDQKSNQATFEHNASCLEAGADLLPNQEILLNYGCRSSGDFFTHNGFVPDEVSLDTIGFNLTLIQRDEVLFNRREKILKGFGIVATYGEYTLRSKDFTKEHLFDPSLTAFLIAFFLEDEEISFAMDSSSFSRITEEIYSRVHRACVEWLSQEQEGVNDNPKNNAGLIDEHEAVILNKIVNRLSTCIKEYISRRASIGVALIDRSLENMKEPPIDTDADQDFGLKFHIARLLQHERKVYEDYLIK